MLYEVITGAALFIAATLSLGLFISTITRTQFQAFQVAFMTMLPSILMSGFVFPFDGMPRVAQWIAQLLPLTHFVEIIRGIVLRGAHLWDMPVQLVITSYSIHYTKLYDCRRRTSTTCERRPRRSAGARSATRNRNNFV